MRGPEEGQGQLFMDTRGTLEVWTSRVWEKCVKVWVCTTEMEIIAIVRTPTLLTLPARGTETHAGLEFLTVPCFK